MSRIISVVLFVVVLFTIGLYPSAEVVVDAVQAVSGNTGGESSPVASGPTPDADLVMATPSPTPTPVPTPSPTPTPTPTPTRPPLMKGTENEEVAAVQRNLVSLGFMYAVVDGIYGSDTEAAVTELIQYLNAIDAKENPVSYPPIDYNVGVDEAGNPLPTPTPHPTKTPKYVVDGTRIDHELQAIADDEDNFPILHESIKNGDSGIDAFRVQRRLDELGYIFKGVDGAFGNKTEEALREFQRVNGLSQTGVADEGTQRMLFSEYAVKSDKPLHTYKLVVDVSDQRVYVYQWNESSEAYDIKYKSMKCSTGKKATPTPLGEFQDSTGPGARWHYFKNFNCWAQYAFYIQGDILFHSVLYSSKGGKVTQSSVNNLGRAASHGCVRLAVKDAQWIWENCTFGTPVTVQK